MIGHKRLIFKPLSGYEKKGKPSLPFLASHPSHSNGRFLANNSRQWNILCWQKQFFICKIFFFANEEFDIFRLM